jgi:hypothetical protein
VVTSNYVPSKSPFRVAAELRAFLEREFQALARAVNRPYDIGDIRLYGNNAEPGVTDMTDAIMALHDALSDGDTLVIPDGVFATQQLEFTKRLNVVIRGTLLRISTATLTDWVLRLSGDDSTLTGGGTVSWNRDAGTDTGRGEAIRLTGYRIRASNVTAADTSSTSGTGNGWYVQGQDCVLTDCKGKNCGYAGVRTTFGTLGSDGEPLGSCSILNFQAINCYRGWVNNGHAGVVNIDNFMIVDPPASGAGLALLGETGADRRFNTCNVSNTHIRFELDPATGDGTMVKFVGVKTVNLSSVTIDTMESAGITALRLQNEHTGTTTYQENTVNAVNCRIRAFDAEAVNIDHLDQWRWNSRNCEFIRGAVDSGNVIDLDLCHSWHSTDDHYSGAGTAYLRVEDLGTDATRSIALIRPRFSGAIDQVISCALTAPDVGQITVVGPRFDSEPSAANWITNSSALDAGVIRSELINGKGALGVGRDFAAAAAVAAVLDAADYETGDRVWIADVGDTGDYLQIKGASAWRAFS